MTEFCLTRRGWGRSFGWLSLLLLALALTGCGKAPKIGDRESAEKRYETHAPDDAPTAEAEPGAPSGGSGNAGSAPPETETEIVDAAPPPPPPERMPAPVTAPPPPPDTKPEPEPASPPTAAPPVESSERRTRSMARRPAPPPSATAPAPGTSPAPSAPAPAPTAGAPAPDAGVTKSGTPVIDEKTDWDVVPVFYGTDRARAADPKRISYGSDRGRRLELGRALVTVPKAHEVPNIERPWAIKVPYFDVKIYEQKEDPKKHFTMKEIQALTKDQFLAFVRERLATSSRYKDHAVIFVHGYNTGFDSAIYRTAQMAYDLKFDGAPFLYSWPSGGTFESYTYDRESSGQSQPFMREFVDLVVKETGAKSVSIIAHSMGNQPVLQILRDLKTSKPKGVVISQIILAAPDVDRDNFENIAQEIKGLANGITLYAAGNDRALKASSRFNGGIPRAGDVPTTGPLVISGIDTIDVTAAGMEGLYLNHSGYAENKALLSDIGLIIQTGERPPDQRFPILQKMTTSAGEYWKYPPKR